MGGKRSGGRGPSTATKVANQSVSLREEISGRTYVDEASLLRVKHLQRLAAWAGAGAGVGPVGALLGRRLAASAEAAGIPLGAAIFLCQRCETILKPGFNCTVRIRNKKNKTKLRKKLNSCQNIVTYACHFCGDQNLILGSGKDVVKILLSSREHSSVDMTCKDFRGNKSNITTQDMKEASKHPQAKNLEVDPPTRLAQLTSERVEEDETLKLNPFTYCKTRERVTLSSVESGYLAVSTFEEGSIQKIVLGNANVERMHETELVSSWNSSKKIETCEASVIQEAEFMVGSEFVTPQKNKLMHPGEPFYTKSIRNKKREGSHSVGVKALNSSSKSVPNDSHKHSKSATSDADALVSSSSRKRVRKRWTTLKQIAKKEEIERNEKMCNFVIPLFVE